jgi:hypothetical protein
VAGDGLRRGPGESAEFPTSVKEVVTLSGKSRRSILNTMGERFTRGMCSISLAFKRHRQDGFFELTNRVGHGHVCAEGVDYRDG